MGSFFLFIGYTVILAVILTTLFVEASLLLRSFRYNIKDSIDVYFEEELDQEEINCRTRALTRKQLWRTLFPLVLLLCFIVSTYYQYGLKTLVIFVLCGTGIISIKKMIDLKSSDHNLSK
jgi:hypothetical protein